MATTSEKMRAWRGPAVLSFGFRPFFLLGAIWAAAAMVLWIGVMTTGASLPTAFDPVSWHAHEMLFGYLGAVLPGFLLTAVPNWTGRLPVMGWPLGGLVLLWLAGRVAVGLSEAAPIQLAAAVDLSCHLALAALIAVEIVSGRNWRNLVVLGLLGLFVLANALFWREAAAGGFPAEELGLRLGLGAAVMMIVVIGGRITPSFTRNWLVKRGDARLPAPFGGIDRLTIAASGAALLLWASAPGAALSGWALLAAGALQLLRLARWSGARTAAEPLVWILHAGAGFVAVGALAVGASVLRPEALAPAAALHLWMAGGVGVMTVAVMSRATLGHTGRPLAADRATLMIYLAVIGAALARFGAGMSGVAATPLLHASAALWIAGFAGFALRYGGPLLRPARRG